MLVVLQYADVAELADALDLGSSVYSNIRKSTYSCGLESFYL